MNFNNLNICTSRNSPISHDFLTKICIEIDEALRVASDWGLSFWSLSEKAPSFAKLSIENREKLLEFLLWEGEIQTSPWSAPGRPVHSADRCFYIHKDFVKEPQ